MDCSTPVVALLKTLAGGCVAQQQPACAVPGDRPVHEARSS
jgi:hypothetical protein